MNYTITCPECSLERTGETFNESFISLRKHFEAQHKNLNFEEVITQGMEELE